jgi:DNA-binding GntR family transcriptional regulator
MFFQRNAADKDQAMNKVWTPIQHTHLADQVYDEVRERILSRVIKIDELINVDEVASELGVSRTPVLDAIKRLSAEGLVEIKARRGTYVKGISAHDLDEIFQMREALELFAAKHVIEGHEYEAVLEKMTAALSVMSVESGNDVFNDHAAFTAADKDFHGTLIAACHNQRLRNAYENLNIYMHIMRSHLYKDLTPPKDAHQEHIQIYEGIKNKDYAATEQAIKIHLKDVHGRILSNIQENGGLI